MEQMGNMGGPSREEGPKAEIIKAAFFMREAIKDIVKFNQNKIPVEEKFFKLTKEYGPQLAVLGLSIESIYDEGKSDMDKPITLVIEDTMKFIDYLSFLEKTDEISLVKNLSYILPEVDGWFTKQIDKNLQKPDFIIEDPALDYLSKMEVILKKLETMKEKWGRKIQSNFLGINIRKLRAFIKFRNKDSLDEFFYIFDEPEDFYEIEKFNENPKDFLELLSGEYSKKEDFQFYVLNKVELLNQSLENAEFDPKYENVFNYICSFLEGILDSKYFDDKEKQNFKSFIENRKQKLEKIIQERK